MRFVHYFLLHDQQSPDTFPSISEVKRKLYDREKRWGKVHSTTQLNDRLWKQKAAMTTLSNTEFGFRLSWRGERQKIHIFPHGGLMTGSRCLHLMMVSGSLTGSLHGSSESLDICIWVETSRLSHCSTVSNLIGNNKTINKISSENFKMCCSCYYFTCCLTFPVQLNTKGCVQMFLLKRERLLALTLQLKQSSRCGDFSKNELFRSLYRDLVQSTFTFEM